MPPSTPTVKDSWRFKLDPQAAIATGTRRAQSGTTLTTQVAPPEHYYADNLQQLLAFVRWRFGAVLAPSTKLYIDRVEALPSDSLRLFARLLSRKGPVFRPGNLRYTEVADLAAAIDGLIHSELLESSAAISADTLLRSVRRSELAQWFPMVASMTKAAALQVLVQRYSDAQIRAQLQRHMQWLTLPNRDQYQMCLRLYFGDRHQDLSAFVIEDLGLMKYPTYPLSPPDWLTDQPQCLQQHELLHHCAAFTHGLSRSQDQQSLANALAQQLLVLPVSREQRQIKDRALLRIAAHLEQHGHLEQALASYAGTQRAPSRERQVRLLAKLGDAEGAEALLQNMRDEPLTAAEMDFAARHGKRHSAQHETTQLCLLGPTPKAIEACAAELLVAQGGCAWHLENQLPLGIAGLLYWDVVFLELPGVFSRPFQLGPNDLFWPDFAEVRKTQLQALESQWQLDPQACLRQLWRTLETHQHTANLLVNWQVFDRHFVDELTSRVPIQALKKLGAFIIRELGRFRSGFPDLLLSHADGSFEFVEVKGPKDQLQSNQRRWLKVLEELELPARVVKLKADSSAHNQ
ncbi:MAG: VRR-NUC domain-containing protein [Pseudomonadales bacterium]